MRKRIIAILLAILAVIAVAKGVADYMEYVSSTIYDESIVHLEEIFDSANQRLNMLVAENWNQMQMWAPYLQKENSTSEIVSYISNAQNKLNFTDFYFISRDAEYYTVDGDRGYLDLHQELADLILNQKPIAVNSVVIDKPEIIVFAVPTAEGTFRDFRYEAIAISYNNSDLVNAMKVSAFGGHAGTYAVLTDGRVVVNNAGEDMDDIHNIYAFLEKCDNFTADDLESLRRDFNRQSFGAMTVEYRGRSYYFLYQPTGFHNWMTVGIVPVDVVNASMDNMQAITSITVTCIAVLLGASVIIMLVRTNRRKLHKLDTALLAREELFSKLSGNADDIFLMLDNKDMKVEYVSPNVKKLLGIPPESVQKDVRVLGKAESGDIPAVSLKTLAEMEHGEQQEWDREYIHQESGEIRFFRVIAFCSDIRGEKKCIIIMSDRTNDRQLTLALKATVDTAENASKAKSAFLSSMSHEIRTPMNAIIGFTGLARASLQDKEKTEDYLKKIQSASDQLLGIINEVLDMSRIESGKIMLNLAEEKISDIIAEIDTVIQTQAAAKQQTLDITSDITHDSVFADRVRLNQICMNLLSNAVKYTPNGGHISFSVSERSCFGDTAQYEIVAEDNGYGMSKEYQRVIFDSFSREEDGRISKIQGTGLGMAITKNFVDLMGGFIRVESEKGKGSRVTVVIPLQIITTDTVRESRQNNVPELPQEKSDALAGLSILAAEDNELNAEILGTAMEMQGARCIICENGREAVNAFLTSAPGHFDLILMDIQMPIMNGYDATRAIRSSNHKSAKTIPIIAMTANAFAEDVQASLDAGMNGHLAKPIVLDEVIKTITKILNR